MIESFYVEMPPLQILPSIVVDETLRNYFLFSGENHNFTIVEGGLTVLHPRSVNDLYARHAALNTVALTVLNRLGYEYKVINKITYQNEYGQLKFKICILRMDERGREINARAIASMSLLRLAQ